MTIHEEAAMAYLDAAKDCACWRCRDAGIQAVLKMAAKRLRRGGDIDDILHEFEGEE